MTRAAFILCPLFLMAVLAACANSDETPTPQLAAAKQAQVVRQELHYVVPNHAGSPGRGTPALSAASRGGFDRFLAEAAGGRPQGLHLTLFGGAPQIAAALREAAVADGVDPAKIEIKPAAPAAGASSGTLGPETTAVATTYRVEQAPCAVTPTDPLSRDQSPGWSDFGCSVNGALAAMVDDPRDLLQGESGGETDSAVSGAAIDRLRQGKLPKFDSPSFTVGGGSSGGGSP